MLYSGYIMRNTHRILRQQVNVANGYTAIISLISLYYIYCIVCAYFMLILSKLRILIVRCIVSIKKYPKPSIIISRTRAINGAPLVHRTVIRIYNYIALLCVRNGAPLRFCKRSQDIVPKIYYYYKHCKHFQESCVDIYYFHSLGRY
jgi:hypothetical protein